MDLRGAEEAFRDALAEAFDEPGLVQVVRFKFGRDLFDVVAPGPFNKVTFDLILLAIREGWAEDLAAAALLANPGNPKLRAFCEAHTVGPRGTTSQALVAPVREAFAGLAALAASPAAGGVREVVVRFRDDFAATRSRIDVLKQYKALHDHLHDLQVRYLRRLNDAVAQVRAGGTDLSEPARAAVLELERFAVELRAAARAARREVNGLPNAQVEAGWADDYEAAAELLDRAAGSADGGRLAKAVERLAGLPREAPRINSLLTATAGELRLERLVLALAAIADVLGPSPDAGGSTARVRDGLAALRRLQPQLAGLIQEHYEWQWLDKEFGLAENTAGRTADDKFTFWSRVRDRLLGLCRLNPTADWAADLTELTDRVEKTGGGADPFPFDRAFMRLRSVQVMRFYNLDLELRDLSERLVQIAGPLDAVLEVAANAGP